MPEVTVLMAVYNGTPYLTLAIESILNQTFTDFEFLIVNDCSTDNTREIILSYNDPRIRLLDNEQNIKQTKSLNRGLEHARTELVARMDADDVSHPKRLEMQAAYMRKRPEVAVLGTGLRFINPDDKVIYAPYIPPKRNIPLRWLQLFACPISNGAAMFRKSIIWDELGGYDPNISYSQDWELWSRVPLKYKLANLPDLLLDVRRHPGAETSKSVNLIRQEQRLINRANPSRILGITDNSEQWLSKVDTVQAQHTEHPEYRLEIIQKYFEHFCALYPSAGNDPDVLSELSYQYIKTLECGCFHELPVLLKALQLAWPISSKRLYISRLARSLAICFGAVRVKGWLQCPFGQINSP